MYVCVCVCVCVCILQYIYNIYIYLCCDVGNALGLTCQFYPNNCRATLYRVLKLLW